MEQDFTEKRIGDMLLYTIPLFDRHGLKNAFTTRFGGVSEGHLSTMNMSFVRADSNSEHVKENYRRLAKALDIDYKSFALSMQVHEDNVHEITENDIGIFITNDNKTVDADALITSRAGVTLVKHTADCTIIYLYDPINHAIGLVHSGWRSCVKNIAGKTIERMNELYNSNPKDMIAGISPCINTCCFEVGAEVSDEFERLFPEKGVVSYEYKKPHVDLTKANEIQLLNADLKDKNIAAANLCTSCNAEKFYSYRRTKGLCGLAIGVLSM